MHVNEVDIYTLDKIKASRKNDIVNKKKPDQRYLTRQIYKYCYLIDSVQSQSNSTLKSVNRNLIRKGKKWHPTGF